jgi:hypothetical protein
MTLTGWTRSPARAVLAALVAVAAMAALLAGADSAVLPRQAGAYSFGATPYDDALVAAAATPRSCSISDNGLRALMLAPTYGETGAGSGTPSPMTLSRYDNQAGLHSFGTTGGHPTAFWHPGVGAWQFDSAGGMSSWGLATAAEHISTSSNAGAGFAAGEMAGRYCAAKQGGYPDWYARLAAWAPWNACGGSGGAICDTIFMEIYDNGVSGDGSVGRYGGMVSRTCARGGTGGPTFTCWYVDPANVQGASGWVSPSWGQSPVTSPFYVFEENNKEVRVWLREDSGYSIDIAATRPLGQNARSSLTWYSSSNLCVRASAVPHTFCDVTSSHPFFDEIEWVAAEEVAEGYDDGDFRPSANVTRMAMAAFLYRLAGSPAYTPPGTATFSDVPTSSPFFDEIEWLVEEGVAGGYPEGTFRPNRAVARQAMAAFMYGMAGDPVFADPVTPSFTDVGTGHTFFTEIEWLASDGVEVTTGYNDGTFRPDSTVTRQAMAAFLERLDPLVTVGG